MKLHHRITSFVATCLLFLFTTQAGLGLWLHTRFHQSLFETQFETAGKKTTASITEVSFSCSCLDYLSTAFVTVDFTSIPTPVSFSFSLEKPIHCISVFSSLQVFRPLRAPPVFVS